MEAPGVEPGSASAPIKRLHDVFCLLFRPENRRQTGFLLGYHCFIFLSGHSATLERQPVLWHLDRRVQANSSGDGSARLLGGESESVVVRCSDCSRYLRRHERRQSCNFIFATHVETVSPPWLSQGKRTISTTMATSTFLVSATSQR